MQNLGLDEAKTGMKIARRNINNLRYADDTTLMAENKEEWKSLLMKVKEQSDKAGLNLNIQKAKIMASGPITSWQIIWRTLEMWQTLFSWAPKSLHKVTVAIKLKDACTLKKKKKKKKAMTNLIRVLKSRDITLPTKVGIVKTMDFPVIMYGCEIWTINNAEHQRIGAFEL